MNRKLLEPNWMDKVVGKVMMKLGKILKNQKLFNAGFDLYNFGQFEEE